MGGGMGAGAVPLSKIFDSGSSLSAAEALARMVPAVAIGNLFAIVMSGLLPKVFKGKGWNGQGALLVNKSNDPHEYDLSEEEMTKREKIDLRRMGIGLFVSGAFFCLGIIINKFFNMVLPDGQFLPKIHSYAWMIISVALCKVFGWLDEDCEIGCYQWFQFISKNLTPMLLIGIGACYVPLQDVISQFTLTYVVLCLVTVLGAVIGSGLIGKLVGFYPVESAITAGLCMANMGGTGDVACLSAADRMELMPFAQISSRIGGAIILLISSVLLSLIPV
jgi:Na+/citrate or Na+/malate symporter